LHTIGQRLWWDARCGRLSRRMDLREECVQGDAARVHVGDLYDARRGSVLRPPLQRLRWHSRLRAELSARWSA